MVCTTVIMPIKACDYSANLCKPIRSILWVTSLLIVKFFKKLDEVI